MNNLTILFFVWGSCLFWSFVWMVKGEFRLAGAYAAIAVIAAILRSRIESGGWR